MSVVVFHFEEAAVNVNFIGNFVINARDLFPSSMSANRRMHCTLNASQNS